MLAAAKIKIFSISKNIKPKKRAPFGAL